jgi:hypothetical protein
MQPRRLNLLVSAVPLCLALWSCGGNNPPPPPPPTAYDQQNTTPINVSLTDNLEVANLDYSTSVFSIVTAAAAGTIQLDQFTGNFTYFPDANVSGVDDFFWQVSDQYGVSNVAEYQIGVGVAAAIPAGHMPVANR